MLARGLFIIASCIFIAVASYIHFGWTGLAIPLAVYLLMPYAYVPQGSR